MAGHKGCGECVMMAKIFDEMEKKLSAIVAVAQDGAIGAAGALLCHLPADLKHFKAMTMGHPIVMGRKTFESFPHGPLPGRQNVVVTRNPDYRAPEGVAVVHSLAEAVEAATMPGEVMVIGGAQIYREAMPLISTLHLTRIEARFPQADTFFPEINAGEWQVDGEEDRHEADERNPFAYSFVCLRRKWPCRQ